MARVAFPEDLRVAAAARLQGTCTGHASHAMAARLHAPAPVAPAWVMAFGHVLMGHGIGHVLMGHGIGHVLMGHGIWSRWVPRAAHSRAAARAPLPTPAQVSSSRAWGEKVWGHMRLSSEGMGAHAPLLRSAGICPILAGMPPPSWSYLPLTSGLRHASAMLPALPHNRTPPCPCPITGLRHAPAP